MKLNKIYINEDFAEKKEWENEQKVQYWKRLLYGCFLKKKLNKKDYMLIIYHFYCTARHQSRILFLLILFIHTHYWHVIDLLVLVRIEAVECTAQIVPIVVMMVSS